MSFSSDWRLNTVDRAGGWQRRKRPSLVFRTPVPQGFNATLSGTTKDANGAALAGCVVDMFKTNTDEFVATTTSDGSGNFTFSIAPVSGPFYLVSYKAGSPDVAGTTVNTLVTS